MKILELYAGSRSIGKTAEQLGHEVFSVDIEPFEGIDLVADIGFLTPGQIPFEPDMIWASPPCTYFSVASIGKHWNKDNTPKTEEAISGIKLLEKTLEIISWFPESIFYMENPRGKMRKMDCLKNVTRATIWYCQYGDTRAKPTDIWTNNIANIFNPSGWTPRSECFNGNVNCHHESAPRGSRTGTQGLKGNYERSKIPEELCREIILATSNKMSEYCN